MKRILSFILVMILAIMLFVPNAFAAEEYKLKSSYEASAILLADLNSGQILYSKNANKEIYPASTTKIMTVILALEHLDFENGTVKVHEAACNYPSTQSLIGLKANEVITVKDLLYGTMLVSGNDGATAIAIEISGSTTEFAVLMNKKAKELGMNNTHFVNAHGVQNVEHVTTAADMLKLTMYAMKNEKFRKIVSTDTYTMAKTNKRAQQVKSNTNRLIVKRYPNRTSDNPYYYEYAIGVKTGSTPAARNCLVAAAEKDGMQLAALVYGDTSNDGVDRWPLCKSLFEYGFSNYGTINLSTLVSNTTITQTIKNGSTANGASNVATFAPTVSEKDLYLTTDKDTVNAIKANSSSLKVEANFDEELAAPLAKGEKYGTADITFNGEKLATLDLYATADMEAASPDEPVSPIQSQAPVDPNDIFKDNSISPWWWLLIPAILIIALVLRIVMVNKRKRSNMRRRVRPYHYRIK